MAIHESGEDYLEAVLMLSKKMPVVRSIDLAMHMSVTKPSVSRAVSILKGDGLLEMGDDGALKLTADGLGIAESVYERHELFRGFLLHIGVEPETAEADACRLEHDISELTFEKLRNYITQNKLTIEDESN